MKTPKIIKTKRMFHRLAELYGLGHDNPYIAQLLTKEFGQKVNANDVKSMIKKQMIIKKQIISTDKDFKEIHKNMIFSLLAKAKENMETVENLKAELEKRFNELKEDMPYAQVTSFNRDLNITARTCNDTIKTVAELLKRMETETTEIKLSKVQEVQQTIIILKDLERAGYIKIDEDFYKSPLYKETNKGLE